VDDVGSDGLSLCLHKVKRTWCKGLVLWTHVHSLVQTRGIKLSFLASEDGLLKVGDDFSPYCSILAKSNHWCISHMLNYHVSHEANTKQDIN